MRKSHMKMCKNKINKYTPPPETTVTHVIEIPTFPPKKDSLLIISSLFLTFVLIFLLSLHIDLFTCLLGEFSPFPSVVHS